MGKDSLLVVCGFGHDLQGSEDEPLEMCPYDIGRRGEVLLIARSKLR